MYFEIICTLEHIAQLITAVSSFDNDAFSFRNRYRYNIMALDFHRKHLDCHSKLSPRRLQGRRSLTCWSELIESYQDFTHWVYV